MRRVGTRWVVAAGFALVAAAGTAGFLLGGDDDPPTQEWHDVPEAQDSAPRPDEPPTTGDHWHTAFGVYVCGSFLETPDTGRDPLGVHSHGDGMIHVHPFTAEATGKRATVGLFVDSTGAVLTDRALEWGGREWREGTATCDGRPGEVVVMTPDRRVADDVGKVRLLDCSWVTIAYVAEGESVPPPPTAGAFNELSDLRSPSDCTKDA